MTIAAGSLVTINPPFNVPFPSTYPVLYLFGDGSAVVIVPGWTQEGAAFDPSQGPNFAAMYLTDTGLTVDLATLTVPVDIPPPAPVAASITLLQLKLCLVTNNLYTTINTAIQASDQTSAAYIAWNSAATIDRTSPLLAALAAQFNLTSQLDALWAQASVIVV